jgi:predicted RNA-binding protein YlqC (UPF0109 family)
MAADVPAAVAYIARGLAAEPDAVKVEEGRRGKRRTVRLTVADDDMGRVIGREGRVANAIRALLEAVPGERWGLEIVD